MQPVLLKDVAQSQLMQPQHQIEAYRGSSDMKVSRLPDLLGNEHEIYPRFHWTISSFLLNSRFLQVQSGPSAVPVLTWKQHLMAGGISRGIAVSSMFPVDTIKTRVSFRIPLF
jgi:hypothetical protein